MKKHTKSSWSSKAGGVLMFGAMAALCGGQTGMAQIPQTQPAPADAADKTQAVSITVTTDKKTYAVGDPIKITLTVKNASRQPVPLRFSTGQRYDFTLTPGAKPDAAKIVWQWSRGRMFSQMVASEKLEAGKTLTYTETLDTKTAAGASHKPLEAGKYLLTGTLATMGASRPSATAAITIK